MQKFNDQITKNIEPILFLKSYVPYILSVTCKVNDKKCWMEAQRKKRKRIKVKSHSCSRGENEVWKYFTI